MTTADSNYADPTLEHLIEMSMPWWHRALPPPVYVRMKFEKLGTNEKAEREKWAQRVYGYGD